MNGFEEIFRQKGLPLVGAKVRCRKNNSVWRVMEREMRRKVEHDPKTNKPREVPAFYLRFECLEPGAPRAVSQIQGHLYTLADASFEANWEVIAEN